MPRHVQQIFIRTSPEQLWRALTDPELTSRYHFAGGLQASTALGEAYEYSTPGGAIRVEGTIEESDPPRRLVTSFRLAGPAAEAAGAADERPSRATWEITPLGRVCRLTLVHDDIHGESPTASFMASRWGPLVSGLKTLLETGEALPSVEGLPEAPTVDVDLAAHREQGIAANNRAWVLLGVPQRSAADDEQLVHAVHASAYHWGYAGTPVNQVRAEYLCSRAYSVLGRAGPALRHAERCLEITGREGLVDFDLAYAHEAMARALACGGRLDEAAAHLEAARAVPIADDEDRSIFDGDLAAEPWFGPTPAPSATVGG